MPLMESTGLTCCSSAGRTRPARGTTKRGKKRIRFQQEMLLPISGKKEVDGITRKVARPSGRQRKAR
jgi:hypothetical protein